jgi:predicted metal-dependent hydrolase
VPSHTFRYHRQIMCKKHRNLICKVTHGCLVIMRGHGSRMPAAKSLENWLRKRAREEIKHHLDAVTQTLQRYPHKVYIMGQRTKWGNCSSLHNLSFNWRLIMAPDFVMRYLVTHEAVHLAVPDHSQRFWLTVQSLCPDMETAKQWLSANSCQLFLDLHQFCLEAVPDARSRKHQKLLNRNPVNKQQTRETTFHGR